MTPAEIAAKLTEAQAPEQEWWCQACRNVGLIHCAHPEECSQMKRRAVLAELDKGAQP